MKYIKNFQEHVNEAAISNYRDKTHFRGAKIKYPDNIFGTITTEEQAHTAINFYQKIIRVFNNLFERKLQIVEASISKDPIDFKIVIRNENGLEPEYFEYPTETMGEHNIIKHINKFVPGTSLRHELLHEAIVPFIIEKFDLINHLDQSANLDDIDAVQRARAFNYTLEDVFYERVVEYLERFPDFLDTFPMSDFGKDVVARIKHEMKDTEPTKENVLATLNHILEIDGTESAFLRETLLNIFGKQNYEHISDLDELIPNIGKQFELYFNVKKDIFSKDLQFKIAHFTELFMDEYYGAVKKIERK
jgi:hypothetical protein